MVSLPRGGHGGVRAAGQAPADLICMLVWPRSRSARARPPHLDSLAGALGIPVPWSVAPWAFQAGSASPRTAALRRLFVLWVVRVGFLAPDQCPDFFPDSNRWPAYQLPRPRDTDQE